MLDRGRPGHPRRFRPRPLRGTPEEPGPAGELARGHPLADAGRGAAGGAERGGPEAEEGAHDHALQGRLHRGGGVPGGDGGGRERYAV